MRKDPDRQELVLLLQKAYWQQLSEQEEKKLLDWRQQDSENEALYKRIVGGESVAEMMIWKEKFNGAAAMAAVGNKIRQRQRRRLFQLFYQVAAMLILLISVGTLFYLHRLAEREQRMEIANSRVQPGSSKAILKLGDGRQVVLDQKSFELKVNSEQIIIGDSATLSYQENPWKEEKEEENRKIDLNTVEVPAGGEYQLILADGTKVWLNAESALTYPVYFRDSVRKVVLEGEAYFEVAHNANVPFVVETSVGAVIEVTGTQFNIKAYRDKQEVKATLVEGGVQVTAGQHKTRLHPRQQFSYDKKTGIALVQEVNVREVVAWKNGYFIFDNTPLEEILETIHRWYDIEIVYRDPAVKHLNFTGDLSKYDAFEAVLRMFEDTRKVKLEIQGNKLFVGRY